MRVKNIIFDLMSIIPDKTFIRIAYYIRMKRKLNISNPVTYNEKIQWLKLYDRKKIYTTMVDKDAVKKYVADIIGEKYLIPTLGVYNSFDEIDFEQLPNKFVIKCTHDSAGSVICEDKKNLDIKNAKKKINNSLSHNYYLNAREWPYKNVPHKIIIEKYMEDKTDGELRDYKFFCFNGKVHLMFIASNRQGEGDTYFDFYDTKFNHLELKHGHPNAPNPPHKPLKFDEMIELSEKLSKGIPHVRIDFYEVNGNVFFCEMTFYHHSGSVPFVPESWDIELGKLIELPSLKNKENKKR